MNCILKRIFQYSCKGSESYLRGYPCSIWLLFHSLTVQEYLKLTNKNATKKSNFTLASNSVLPTMKGYIKLFFPCTSCVKNFEEDTIDLENQLVNSNSSILWLWNIHNKMNLMFINKTNDDAEWPKQIYPTYEQCKNCYLSDPKNSQLAKFEDLKGIWNETEVLNLLINQYRKESLVKSSSAASQSNLNLLLLIIFPFLISRYLSLK